jgi:hypothetical protein
MAKPERTPFAGLFQQHRFICIILGIGVHWFCISYYLLSGDANKSPIFGLDLAELSCPVIAQLNIGKQSVS